MIEILICKLLLKVMIRSPRVRIAFNRDVDGSNGDAGFDFVLLPPRLWTTIKIMALPNLWVGESFIAGAWYLRKGDLSDFLETIRKDAPEGFERYYQFTAALRGLRYYLGQYLLNRYYTRKVKRHYDVDSRIYEMILDPEMLYTCAFFEDGNETLQAAQGKKLAAAISRMILAEGPAKVLDIGCGWGAMARAVVRRYPHAEVCGLSISKNQIDWAAKRDSQVLAADQLCRVEYRLEDYADHQRTNFYDGVSVIGMIEHVGLTGYDTFFGCVFRFLKPGGTALVHTIVSPTPANPTNRWIDRHIFTGGHTPSVSELTRAIERHPFQIEGLYIYRPRHYRRTIECWLQNFRSNVSCVSNYLRTLGESEAKIDKFIRIWLFYLSGVRNMFSEDDPRSHQIVQLSITKLGA
jgi:cyclopropane-fatty-acyl-phospholipid synthase